MHVFLSERLFNEYQKAVEVKNAESESKKYTSIVFLKYMEIQNFQAWHIITLSNIWNQ